MEQDKGREEARRAEVEETYARFLAESGAEERVEFEELLRRHPDMAAELRELHAGCQLLQEQLSLLGPPEEPEGVPGPAAGQRVGPFRLVRRIGRGAMGEVWEAEEPALGRRVALKLLLPDRLTPRGIGFFEREARAGAKIEHPGVAAVHAAGRSGAFLWISQQLVEDARTLSEVLEGGSRPDRPQDFQRIAELFRDVARAMQAAHDAGVVHRDLKPNNVLLGRDGKPRVVDFGLARILDEHSLSHTGDIVGTYSYMSPEQISGRHGEIDGRTDVFSLGVMLYEALTHERPFEAESSAARANRILQDDPVDPRRLDPRVPSDLATICNKALEKSPARRFQSMAELADELDRYLRDLPIRTRPPGLFGHLGRWRRRHPVASSVLFAVAAGLLALLALGLVANRRLRAQRLAQHLTEATLHAAYGDRAQEQRALEEARRLAPDDPLVLLAQALCEAARSEFPAAQRHVAAAIERGFDPNAVADDALGLCMRGLYHLRSADPREIRRAERLLSQALEEDPRLRMGWFPLYQARFSLGDVDGAREALREVDAMPLTDTWETLVESLLLELDGHYEEALARLIQLQETGALDAENGARVLGRLYLRLDRPLEAQALLLQALERAPGDVASRVNLAQALLVRSAQTSGSSADALRWEAIAAAELARDANPDYALTHATLAEIALYELELVRANTPGDAPSVWSRFEEHVDDLRALEPDWPTLGHLESERLVREAQALLRGDDPASAAPLLREALERDPKNLRAGVLLGQTLLAHLEQPAEAAAELARALETWERSLAPDPRPPSQSPFAVQGWPRRWLLAIQIWRLGAAGALGDEDLAREARDAVEAELAAGEELPFAEGATYAEFLALAPEEVRDCERVRELLATGGLRLELSRHPQGPEMLERIDAACP